MKKTIYYLSLVALGFGCLVLFAFIQVIIEDAFPEITKSVFFTELDTHHYFWRYNILI